MKRIILSIVVAVSFLAPLAGSEVSAQRGKPSSVFSIAAPSAYARESHSSGLVKQSDRSSSLEAKARAAHCKSQLSFEANCGQFDSRVKFFSRGNGYNLYLTSTAAVLALTKKTGKASGVRQKSSTKRAASQEQGLAGGVLTMKLVGANPTPRIEGLEQTPARTNYFIGKDSKKWHVNVTNYGKIKYGSVYRGVDLIYYGVGQQLEYDFIVSPGAAPKKILLEFKGANKLSIDASGNLTLHTAAGEVQHRRPLIYQELNGTRKEVIGRYVLKGKNRVGFQLDKYDSRRPLVIDPAIVYSTYLNHSIADAIALYTDTAGKTFAYVVGTTTDTDFPIKNGLYPSHNGNGDAFIAKLDLSAAGEDSLIYSTYLGGSDDDEGKGIAMDSAGDVYITGFTESNDFPTLFPLPDNLRGAFVTKLKGDGSSLFYSTYLRNCRANSIAVDSAGNAYITGSAGSGFPATANAYQPSYPGIIDGRSNAYVVKLIPPSGANPVSLAYATYFGGSLGSFPWEARGDVGNGIAVDSAGCIYITGYTVSTDFPTVNAFQSNRGWDWGNAFVAKLNPLASGAASLVYSTYLGGSGGTVSGGDVGHSIAVDSAGKACITGKARSSDFPTTAGAFQMTGNDAAFVAKVDPSKIGIESLVYSTYLGSNSSANDIALDSIGNAYVTGSASFGFPTVNPIQRFNAGVFQSANSGNGWAGFNNGLTDLRITALAVDTITVQHSLYAGTKADGLFKSTDGGINWSAINSGLSKRYIHGLAINPANASTLYVVTSDPDDVPLHSGFVTASNGVFKTTDGGNSWNPINQGFTDAAMSSVHCLAFDVVAGTPVLYAGTDDGLYRFNDGTSTWSPTSLPNAVHRIALDINTTPNTLYALSIFYSGFKSTDGGSTWIELPQPSGGFFNIAVDSSTVPSTLYAYDQEIIRPWKSTDSGNTWFLTGIAGLAGSGDIRAGIVIDTTTTPSTIYAFDIQNGISRSTDGGDNWTRIFGQSVGAIAIDPTSATPTTPGTLYIGTFFQQSDGFVAKLDPTGSVLLFSTYLGGPGGFGLGQEGRGISLDPYGNIYVTGSTDSPYFPVVNAYQASLERTGIIGGVSGAFIAKLGDAALPLSPAGCISNCSVTTQVATQTGTLAITFPNVTGSTNAAPPAVTVTPLDSATTANFSLSNNLGSFEVSTTATYTASPSQPVTLCFQVLTVNDPTTFNNLRVMHVENGVPVDVTSSHDFASRTICASVTSLSPFIIVKGASDQLSDLIRLVRTFNLQRGIENSLDAKLQNAQDALTAERSGNRLSACNLMASFVSEAQAQSGRALTATQANQLIVAANQIKAVLDCG